jgi:hypothetical protein
LIGFLAYAFRNWKIALACVLFTVLPGLAFMKYDWYRPHFLYAVFGLGSVGLAMLVGLLLKPKEQVATAPWSPMWRVATVFALVTFMASTAIAWRRSQRLDPKLLSSHMREAVVSLDHVPCDYWNPQVERWECSGFDGSGWAMTGRMLEPYTVKGKPRQAIWLHPNPSKRWRIVTFPALDAKSVALSIALGDQTREGPVEVQVLARGQEPIQLTLRAPGEELDRSVPIAPGQGPALVIKAKSTEPGWKHLIVEGRLH